MSITIFNKTFNTTFFTTKNNLFLITNSPTNQTLQEYVKILLNNNITVVIRLCEKTYDEDYLKQNNINFIDMFIEDGMYPSDTDITNFFNICSKYQNIAIHCKSGLGRAPLLVAIHYIIVEKKSTIETITFIRDKIKGAFNTKQLNFINHDISKKKNLYKDNSFCQIM
jgi:protein tyrosine phosphatase type 4A